MSGFSLADVRKLQIQDGDVLILPEGADHSAVSALLDRLRELEPAPKNVTVACCQVERISEAQMNAAGWYRK